MGVLLGTVTLLLGIVSRNYEGYEVVVPKVRACASCIGGDQGRLLRWVTEHGTEKEADQTGCPALYVLARVDAKACIAPVTANMQVCA